MGAHGELPPRGARLLRSPRRRGSAARALPRALLALLAALGPCACGSSHPRPRARPAAATRLANWSTPGTLSDCGGEDPTVAFPSDEPTHASGPGAVVWRGSAACPGGGGVRVAEVASTDVPRAGVVPRSGTGRPFALRAPLEVSGAPHGEVAIAGAAGPAGGGEAIEGAAGGPFAALLAPSGFSAPFAMYTAYLGDLALAAPPGGRSRARGLALHIERYFTHTFVRNLEVGAATGGAQALALALDYRTDALLAWARDGALYARFLPGRGPSEGPQRLAAVGSHVKVAALLSDDYRGILLWSEQRGPETSVYFDQSGVGVHFARPRLLERFGDADGLSAPAGSPRIVRLSDESVMAAWSAVAGSHWLVRTAAIDQHGIGAASTIAAPGRDALLCALSSGPAADGLVLFTEPEGGEQGHPDLARQTLFAARGIDAHPRRTVFGPPEEIAANDVGGEAAVAIDPDSDRALAAWPAAAAGGGVIEYAVRSGAPGR